MRHELHITKMGLRAYLPAALACMLAGWLVAGAPGAASAGLGAAVIGGNHLVAAVSTGWSKRFNPAVIGIAYSVFVFRMMAVFGALAVLSVMPWIHKPLLAATFGATLAVTLAAECVSYARKSFVPAWRIR